MINNTELKLKQQSHNYAVILSIIGIIILYIGISKMFLGGSGIGYHFKYHQYFVNNGFFELILGIGFVVGAYIRFRNRLKNRK